MNIVSAKFFVPTVFVHFRSTPFIHLRRSVQTATITKQAEPIILPNNTKTKNRRSRRKSPLSTHNTNTNDNTNVINNDRVQVDPNNSNIQTSSGISDRIKQHQKFFIERGVKNNRSFSNPGGSLTPLQRSSNREINYLRDRIIFECKTPNSVHQLLIENDNICDTSVYTCAIRQCSKHLWWKDCLKIVDLSLKYNKIRDKFFYSTLFNAAAENDRIIDVFPKYYQLMIKTDKVRPDNYTIAPLIKGCVLRGKLEIAIQLWELFDIYKIEPDDVSFNLMIGVCANANDISLAQNIFLQCNNPSRQVINSFLGALSKSRNYEKFEKYKRLLFDKYKNKDGTLSSNSNSNSNSPRAIDYNQLMASYLRFKMPMKVLELFKSMIHDSIKPNATSLGLLQVATYTLQLQSGSSDKLKMEKYHRHVVETIPGQMIQVMNGNCKFNRKRSINGINGINSNGNDNEIPHSNAELIIKSWLHIYGQHRWYEIMNEKVEDLMKTYKIGFWCFSNIDNEWNIDMHLLSPEMSVFALRYIFIKDKDFILSLKHDLAIIVGRGRHRQGYKRNLKVLLGDIVSHETQCWKPKLILHEPKDSRRGLLLAKINDVKLFYDNLSDEKRFFNQVTDTCIKFAPDWTDVCN